MHPKLVQCTDTLISLAVGLTGACIPADFIQLVATVIWMLQIYYLYFFTMIWTLASELDTLTMHWTSSMGPKNPTNMISQIY